MTEKNTVKSLGLRSLLTFTQATEGINHACVSRKLPKIYTPPIAIFDEFIVEQGYPLLKHLDMKPMFESVQNPHYPQRHWIKMNLTHMRNERGREKPCQAKAYSRAVLCECEKRKHRTCSLTGFQAASHSHATALKLC